MKFFGGACKIMVALTATEDLVHVALLRLPIRAFHVRLLDAAECSDIPCPSAAHAPSCLLFFQANFDAEVT
jgi:hypothetical protein